MICVNIAELAPRFGNEVSPESYVFETSRYVVLATLHLNSCI